MSSQYGEFWPTNGWDHLASLRHPSKFQPVSSFVFVTAATYLIGSQPNCARCLAIPGLVHYTFSEALAPWRNFVWCKIHFTSESCVLLYWQHYCTTRQQGASAKLCGVVQGMGLRNFRRGRHLYSAGRSSRWASAHIVVYFFILYIVIHHHSLLTAIAAHSNGQAIIFCSCGFYLSFFLLFLSFFFPRLISAVGDCMSATIPHMMWCGLSANLECRSEMRCTQHAGNAGPKNRPKIAIWAPSHNLVGLYLRN